MKSKEQIAAEKAVRDGEDSAVKAELKALIDEQVESVKKELEEKYNKDLEARVAEHKEAMEKKAGIYNQDVKADRKALNDVTRNIVKALISGDTMALKALATTPDANGGYLVNTELATEIQRLATEFGVSRREMRVITMTSHSMRIPLSLTDISVYWTGEAVAKKSTAPTFTQATLELKKIAAIVPMTDEFIEDSEFDIFGYISEVAAEKIAEKEDLAFFTGDGTSGFGSYTGLLNSANVNEVILSGAAFTDLTADDLMDLKDATAAGAIANGKYYMHRTIMSIVRKLKDNEGVFVYQAPSERGPATIWGYQVVEVEVMPKASDSAAETSFVLFGDLRKACWVGVKANGLSFMSSNQATIRNVAGDADIHLFEQDMTALRFVERIGYTEVLPLAVSKLTTAEASA